MSDTNPILLSFYGLSNGKRNLLMGQLTISSLRDFSFRSYSTRKTFRTLLALYRTRFFANRKITLHFDHGSAETQTDASGSFFFQEDSVPLRSALREIRLQSGQPVKILQDLYHCDIRPVTAETIMISDIDDTLLHSHISNKLLKLRTLLFTSAENRKAVVSMRKLVSDLREAGVVPFYLSNSEQNLYPLIFRFLKHNGFPEGPLFLKQMRKIRDVFRTVRMEDRDVHKTKMLDEIFSLFPDKKFFLLGDNTQNDLKIYLKIAERFPENVRYIVIRKVLKTVHDPAFLSHTTEQLRRSGIGFFYDDNFPSTFDLE